MPIFSSGAKFKRSPEEPVQKNQLIGTNRAQIFNFLNEAFQLYLSQQILFRSHWSIFTTCIGEGVKQILMIVPFSHEHLPAYKKIANIEVLTDILLHCSDLKTYRGKKLKQLISLFFSSIFLLTALFCSTTLLQQKGWGFPFQQVT